MYRHILFPTDGHAPSTRATRTAIAFARKLGARLTVLHVIPPFIPPLAIDGYVPYPELYLPEEYERATRKETKRMLERIQARARKAGVACDTVALTAEAPWKALLDVARKKRCDAIVMASHGRRGAAALLLGSETTKVLTHSKLPVLVCR